MLDRRFKSLERHPRLACPEELWRPTLSSFSLQEIKPTNEDWLQIILSRHRDNPSQFPLNLNSLVQYVMGLCAAAHEKIEYVQ